MNLKIAILGTRGIPNYYGGYEQVASYLAPGLVEKGHQVTVYNSHNHPYSDDSWNGVEIVHCTDPEKKIGTAGQFIYDWNCIRHARKCNYDVILALGYTSSSVWGRLYPKQSQLISNMDGLEWKRTKYSPPVRRFLRYAERLAIKYSGYYIADSIIIRNYLYEKYGVNAQYIPYGADIPPVPGVDVLEPLELAAKPYYLLIARMEPENNIEMILDGYCLSGSLHPFVVAGNTATGFGKKMLEKYQAHPSIRFIGACFDQQLLEALRHYCLLYFHGHSVGGTNPSLLEAMASGAPIAAHDNPFNRSVTEKNATYFSSAEHVRQIILDQKAYPEMIAANLNKIREQYNWQAVIDQYESFIVQCHLISTHE